MTVTHPSEPCNSGNRAFGELLRMTKHATQTKFVHTDHPLESWMFRHCWWLHCTFHVRLDGGTTRCSETSYKEVGLLVSEKSFGPELQKRGCCVASSK